MIHITQGHQKGIGLEVFFKALEGIKKQQEFCLYGNKDSIAETLESLQMPFNIDDDKIQYKSEVIQFVPIKSPNTETIDSLNIALEASKNNEVINTLPSSKDQFVYNQKSYRGHTHYLEDYFGSDPTMCFLSPQTNFMLLTDHIPLDQVFNYVSNMDVPYKISNALRTFPKERKAKEIFIAGINPHIGEDGIISEQDNVIKKSATVLKGVFDQVSIHSGDTMHFHIKDKSQLFVYPSHDQGLGVFKALYGLIGINFTAGVQKRRVSVDHGTAFDLFGKNQADWQGMKFLLSEVQNW